MSSDRNALANFQRHGYLLVEDLFSEAEIAALVEPLFERVYCEMTPGSVLFFHCNLLRSSAPNLSDRPRRAFMTCYNALSNPAMLVEGGAPKEPSPTGPDDWLKESVGIHTIDV